MRELLAALNEALDRGRLCVYCSVVETRGSTPQKAGAAMLVFPDGSQTGTLGGGCVEAEVKRQALRVLSGEVHQGKPDVLTFCLDDNYGWDDGLICGGRMSILADPLAGSNGSTPTRESIQAYYRSFRSMVEKGLGCTEAVVTGDQLQVPIGSRFLLDAQGQVVQQLSSVSFHPTIGRNLVPLARRPKAYVKEGVAYLPVLPRVTLLIVGAGHVGQAVAKLGSEVDFDVWVLDDRETYASKERFPQAQRRLVGDIGSQLQELGPQIYPSVFALIVTRGHGHDEEALYHLATTPAGYIGMIGSKRKIKLIYEDLLARGIPREALERVHAPLGFAIGSQTVPEIAVSIVAELIACRNLGQTISEARTWVKL
jgi:xanthine dehydrogenase accessory factor